MSLFISKPKPLYAPMLATIGGGSISGFKPKSAGGLPPLPTATLLHIEDPATNYNANKIWQATVGSNVDFNNGTVGSIQTDSDGNSYLQYGNGQYGLAGNFTMPAQVTIISVLRQSGADPFILEHASTGSNANNVNGMYHYSDTGFSYGVNRGGAGALSGWDPHDGGGGNGTRDPVAANTKSFFGSIMTSTTDVKFHTTATVNKVNGISVHGSGTVPNNSVTQDLWFGSSPAGSSINFTGRLYEVYISVQSEADFDKTITYMKAKFNL